MLKPGFPDNTVVYVIVEDDGSLTLPMVEIDGESVPAVLLDTTYIGG